MIPIFLLGGGWRPEAFSDTYGQFLHAATRAGQRKIVAILAASHGDDAAAMFDRYADLFHGLGAAPAELVACPVSPSQPLTREQLAELAPTGVLVCGGATPVYQEALCADQGWLDYLLAQGIPYAEFSAGASIAAGRAVVGGWLAQRDGRDIAILDEELAEELDQLAVRDGLGLLPFSIDVHASQWGTLTRLLHAVDLDLAPGGWAIDEDTMLQVADDKVTVHGQGSAYRVTRTEPGRLSVELLRAGDSVPLDQPAQTLMLERSLRSIYNYRRLSPRLATAGQPTEQQLASVAEAGFEAVIYLALAHGGNALPDERGAVQSLGMAYEHIPVIWQQPTLEDFQRFIAVMDALADKRLFVHCAANMRVSAFVALYRITQQGWAVDQAMAHVHDIWQPDGVWKELIDQILS